MNPKFRKLISDGGINIIATGILILTQQFMIFPLISRDTTIEMFGIVLIIIAIKNMLMQVLGGTLNNLKLINYNVNNPNTQNYNLILILSILLGEIIALIFLTLYSQYLTGLDYLFILTTIGVSIINVYGTVYFRINLNYRNIFMFNITYVIASIFGLIVYLYYFNSWSIIFFIAEVSSFIFLVFTTPILHEFAKGIKKSNVFGSKYLNLLFSSVISNTIIYFDRVLISPILGERAVSQFYVASLTGKSFSLVITPLNGVILSYASRYRNRITKQIFKLLCLLVIIFIIISLPILNIVSPFFINLLYPNIYEDAKNLINLANIVVITGLSSSILNPFILITCDLKWQTRVNLIYGILYLGLGIILTSVYGLYGFCVSSIISNSSRLILIYLVGLFASENP